MTNPPVPATPLDVEACVRTLIGHALNDETTAKAHRRTAAGTMNHAERARSVWRAECHEHGAQTLRALASALPGMGKKADWYDWLADEDHVDWTRRLGNGNFAIETPPFGAKPDIERATLGECIDAARAAQPEETSADG